MNPNSSESSGMELPPPAVGSPNLPPAGGPTGESAPVASPEAAPAAPERAPQVAQGAPAAAQPVMTLPTPPSPAAAAATANNPASASGSTGLPLVDDGDLIEKEWVDKAKQIVERTRDDPHKQSEELTVFKADYMQKRYGKSIKLSQ